MKIETLSNDIFNSFKNIVTRGIGISNMCIVVVSSGMGIVILCYVIVTSGNEIGKPHGQIGSTIIEMGKNCKAMTSLRDRSDMWSICKGRPCGWPVRLRKWIVKRSNYKGKSHGWPGRSRKRIGKRSICKVNSRKWSVMLRNYKGKSRKHIVKWCNCWK